ERPQLGPLPSRIPLPEGIAQREYPLFRTRALLFATSASDGGIELMFVERVQQGGRFQLAAAPRNAEFQRVRSCGDRVFVPVNNQTHADFFAEPVAKFDHFFEFVAGVDMKKWKWHRPGVESLAGQMDKNTGVLTDRIEQYGIAELRNGFPQDINRFAFKLAKMRPVFVHVSKSVETQP